VGRRCRAATIQDVTRELLHLDWKDGQGSRQAVYARTAPKGGNAGAAVLGARGVDRAFASFYAVPAAFQGVSIPINVIRL